MKTQFIQELWRDVCLIREKRPLILNITNLVVTNFTANALLSLGASPLMAHAPEELEEIVDLSSAMNLNIGTLDASLIASMKIAIRRATSKRIPVVLDPVGAGASNFRTQSVNEILGTGADFILKGNASEIIALTGEKIISRGVEASVRSADVLDSLAEILRNENIRVLGVSGEEDFIFSKDKKIRILNGSPIMAQVTGMGCILSSITAAFCSIDPDYFKATANAFACVGIAGELAASDSRGPGSFQVSFIDHLRSLDLKQITERLRVSDE